MVLVPKEGMETIVLITLEHMWMEIIGIVKARLASIVMMEK